MDSVLDPLLLRISGRHDEDCLLTLLMTSRAGVLSDLIVSCSCQHHAQAGNCGSTQPAFSVIFMHLLGLHTSYPQSSHNNQSEKENTKHEFQERLV
jgi:hypothetical protein